MFIVKTQGLFFDYRTESAHARLKLYLRDTISSLQTSFKKIHKILRIQFGDIKKSFERSLNISRHKHLHEIFSQVRCRILLEAMELIYGQLQCVKEVSHQLVGRCNCSIEIVYALPYKHDLAYYHYFFHSNSTTEYRCSLEEVVYARTWV